MAEFQYLPSTRSDARTIGSKKYFTGKPCKHGHVAPRWAYCKTCAECKAIEAKSERSVARQKRYREKEENKRIKKDQLLQSQYGITLVEFEALISAQNGQCAICQIPIFRGKGNQGAAVDHCHPTGRVRGILCSRCNRGLGFFRDHVDVLRRALSYLTRGDA